MKKIAFKDQEKRTIAEGYNELALCSIFDQFWHQSYSNKLVVVGNNLRAHLNYLLGYLLLIQGESP